MDNEETNAAPDSVKRELKELRSWKRQAIKVMPPLQEIGEVLGIPLGQSIHDKILPAVKTLKQDRDSARKAIKLLVSRRQHIPWTEVSESTVNSYISEAEKL